MIVIAFEIERNSIADFFHCKNFYAANWNDAVIDQSRAKTFENKEDAEKWYIENYSKMKPYSIVNHWYEDGVNVDKPYFIEIEKED